MSIEENKALVRRYFAEVVNRVDPVAAERLVASDLVFNSPYTPEPTRDRESFLGMLRAVHAAIPDFHLEDHVLLAEGDLVASRWTVHGTHLGQLGPFAPTGEPLAITGLSIYRVAGGRIAEGWIEDRTMEVMAVRAGRGSPATEATAP